MIKTKHRGFTLIELLIVIALLGTLAVALLAALDPFEQIKKGADTGVRNTVSEVHSSVIRFYALKGNMPWCSATASTTCTDPGGASNSLTDVNTGDATTSPYAMIDQMVTAGELKANFVVLAGAQMDKIFVTGDSTNNTISSCYKPTAKSFQADPNTKYKQDGTVGSPAAGTCKSAGGTDDCFWCVQ